MRQMVLLALAGIAALAMAGCAGRTDRSVNLEYLSSFSPGSRFVIMEPKVKMPFISKRQPYVRHEMRVEQVRWQETMENAFKAAGHDVVPLAEARKVFDEMNPRYLVEKKPFRPPALYSNMRIDRAVFFDVIIRVRKGQRVREDINIRIYDTRTGKRVQKIRWRIDLTKLEQGVIPPAEPET